MPSSPCGCLPARALRTFDISKSRTGQGQVRESQQERTGECSCIKCLLCVSLDALVLSAACMSAWPCRGLPLSPLRHRRQGGLGSLAGLGRGETQCAQVRAVMGLLSSGVFGWPAEECRGGVTAEDTLICGLRRVLLCPGHHVLALPGSRVRRAPVVSLLVQEAPGRGSPLGLWAPMKPPSLSSLAHPQGPKQAGQIVGGGC